MKAAQLIVKILEREGITNAFGIPGAGINPVYQFLGESKTIRHYTMRHEEAALHAADGYFRSSGRMALAICTSGPGATNFVTGLYTAMVDSIPLIAITGQAARSQLGKDAFQCVDIAAISAPVTKGSWCICDPAEIPSVFAHAFRLAREGKPGPVLIDLPLDVQTAECDFDFADYSPEPVPVPQPDGELLRRAHALIQEAASPVIIMGGGVILSGCERKLVAYAEQMDIPVIPTYMAKGGIPASHPLCAGHAGIQVGGPVANRVFLESDVVLGVGCRFSDRHTGELGVYRGARKFIHINISEREIGKIIDPEIGIVSDAGPAVEGLLALARENGKRERGSTQRLEALRRELERGDYSTRKPIKPQRVYHELNRCFDGDTFFTTGCGLTQIWSGQLQKIEEPRRYLPSGGAGTLGFDIPAAIGACAANPGCRAVAVMGDFGFTFLIEELAVAAKYRLPVTVVIVNNAYLGLIRQNQKYAYGFEYAVEMGENHGLIDYVKVAEGFGCTALRVFEPEGIAPAFEQAKREQGPVVIDIVVEERTDCSMGNSLDKIREFPVDGERSKG